MDISLVLSILSIAISLFVAYKQKEQEDHLNEVNLKADYYSRIFDDYLISKLPKARNYIRFDNEDSKLKDVEDFTNCLNEMVTDAIFLNMTITE